MQLSALALTDSPLGRLAIGATDRGVAMLQILDSTGPLAFKNSQIAQDHIDRAVYQLSQYFAGELAKFDLSLDLAGTDFQLAVWAALAQVGKSKSVSYSELALAAGRPLAARAVGGAVGANPVPIILGCHRVLGSGGTLTGYSATGGLKTKQWLLDFEGIEFKR